MSQSDPQSAFNRPRMVAKKVLAKPQHEGDGAVVRRSIGRLVFFFKWGSSSVYFFVFFIVFLKIAHLGSEFFFIYFYFWFSGVN